MRRRSSGILALVVASQNAVYVLTSPFGSRTLSTINVAGQSEQIPRRESTLHCGVAIVRMRWLSETNVVGRMETARATQ